ncbi:phage holin family protein [Kribbella sp. NPDC056861]|uniref:phage holin family protein n=1 Tax=Kribbella sp. NPDC056861 TaxID=3154857 RepID=UPI00343C0B47
MTFDGSAVPGGGANRVSVDDSVGELVSQLTTDLGDLTRQELALAKAELQAEAKKAGKGAGMLGGAALAGWMVALFLSLTVMYALDEAMDLIWAALIVTVLWAIAASVLAMSGRKELAEVSPKPDQTVESLKEDAKWLKTRKS